MPLAQLGGLVVEQPRVGAERDLPQHLAELQVRGRRVHRVRFADDDQHLHAAGVHVDDQLAERGVLFARDRFRRRQIRHRLAGVAEQVVDGVRQGVDGGRLRFAGDDQRRAAMRGQVLGDRADERLAAGRRGAAGAADADGGGQRAGEPVDLAALQRQAMVGAAAGDRRRRFDDVEPAQTIRVGVDAAARRKGARVLHAEGVLGGQEVGVERDDDRGLLEVVDRFDVVAEGDPGAGAGVVPRRRIPLDPLGLGKAGQDLLDLGGQGRRVDRLGQDAQAGARAGRLRRQRAAHRRDEPAPRPHAAEFGDRVRAIRIVEGEDRRLGEQVGAAAGGRVVDVALDLGRAAFVALDQEPGGDAAERHRGGEEQRLAGNDVLGHPYVGHDQLVGLARAARDAGQRERCAHQLEESAPADRVVPFRRVRGELAVEEFLELGRLGDGFEAAPGT